MSSELTIALPLTETQELLRKLWRFAAAMQLAHVTFEDVAEQATKTFADPQIAGGLTDATASATDPTPADASAADPQPLATSA